MNQIWTIELVVYLTAALGSALAAIYLLRMENKERKSTDAPLGLPEALEGIPALGRALEKEAGVRPQSPNKSGVHTRPNGDDETPAPGSEPRELRKTRRFPVSIFAKVTRLDGKKGIFECEIADISQGGLCLCLPEFIPSETLVGIEFLYRSYFGVVCRAQEVGGLFITGIQFEDPIDLAEISQILHVADLETKESAVSVRSAHEMVDTYLGDRPQ
jgi:PilZ domain-containing protein